MRRRKWWRRGFERRCQLWGRRRLRQWLQFRCATGLFAVGVVPGSRPNPRVTAEQKQSPVVVAVAGLVCYGCRKLLAESEPALLPSFVGQQALGLSRSLRLRYHALTQPAPRGPATHRHHKPGRAQGGNQQLPPGRRRRRQRRRREGASGCRQLIERDLKQNCVKQNCSLFDSSAQGLVMADTVPSSRPK